jgi:hypothetical protein
LRLEGRVASSKEQKLKEGPKREEEEGEEEEEDDK